ncbi:AraC family transcriptional regulator [Alteromonadaceae bacterium M269]|nr:AraC family transcriptional regulator [Alteromonadaceae bacterium M269]
MHASKGVKFVNAVTAQSRQANIYNDIELAQWSVSEGDVVYQRRDLHTLSVYLNGGNNTYRIDHSNRKGGPNTVSFMPRNHQSSWAIRDDIKFTHLYIPQKTLNWFFVNTFDVDVREATLRDFLYRPDSLLASQILKLTSIVQNDANLDHLTLEQTTLDIMYHFCHNYLLAFKSNSLILGGLSPFHRKLTRNFILSQFTEKLSIHDMSELTGLSVFHFAKMFRLSFGLTPAESVILLRVERVKQLLLTDASLADISLWAGFSHQSHMTQSFRARTGKTPAQYRKLLKS